MKDDKRGLGPGLRRNDSPSGAPRRRPECDRAVSAEQQVRFLLGVRNGLTVAAAARWAGVAVATLYYRRRIDASFADLWQEARAGADADAAAVRAAERAAAEAAQGTKVCAHGNKLLVRKRRRAVDFTPARKQLFLDHFAESCNQAAAAAAAGVTERHVRKALAEDEAFAEGFDVALGVGYKALEADTLHTQQMAYRLSPDGPEGAGDKQTFERSMQLLNEFRRRDGTIGRRPSRLNRKMASKEEWCRRWRSWSARSGSAMPCGGNRGSCRRRTETGRWTVNRTLTRPVFICRDFRAARCPPGSKSL